MDKDFKMDAKTEAPQVINLNSNPLLINVAYLLLSSWSQHFYLLLIIVSIKADVWTFILLVTYKINHASIYFPNTKEQYITKLN